MESPISPWPKKARQVKSKAKNMLAISFNIKGIVHKEFVMAGQTVNFAYYCDTGIIVVKALYYKPESRRFDTR
jgi:hypothetical protein